MSKRIRESDDNNSNKKQKTDESTNQELSIPLQFWFNRNPTLAFPYHAFIYKHPNELPNENFYTYNIFDP
jgi:hypothetical protein